MSFVREKRLLLGWLALGAPLPLPLNQVLEWPALFLYLFAVVFFLRRAEDPAFSPLTNRQLNVLGLIYLPLLGVDLWLGASRGQMVPTLLHMLLFVLVVKLFAIRQEKDKWQVLLAIFFVFVASMATSSHAAVALYLLAATVAGVVVLGRLAYWHTLAALGRERQAAALPAKPIRRTAVAGILASVVLAIPIFAIMPRFTEPFLVRRGGDGFALGRVSGFTDDVGLDGSGLIRSSREIAMRIQFTGTVLAPESMRFKGSTQDYYRNRRWWRENTAFTDVPPPGDDNRFVLRASAAGDPSSAVAPPNPAIGGATIYLAPIQSGTVIVPTEAVSVRFRSRQTLFYRDGGGGLTLPNGQRRDDLIYDVELGARAEIWPELTTDAEGAVLALDQSGVSARIAALAREVAGEGTDAEKLQRLESHLLTSYGYTLDLPDSGEVDPIEYFLFESRAGNCERFASALVLMARSQGIPARFATGFLGAEPNPIEDFHIVRQSNAHAWVEAMAAPGQWQVYDPTPPIGRPSISPQSLRLLLQQLYDFVLFRWDRYVLTYGAEDQLTLRQRLAAWLERFKEWFGEEDQKPASREAPPASAIEQAAAAEAVDRRDWRWPIAGGIAFLLATALLAWRAWRRQRATASLLFARLRRDLEQNDLGIHPATPPLAVFTQIAELLPTQAPALAELRRRYLHESFAGEKEAVPVAEVKALPTLLRQALAARRRAMRRRKGSSSF